jgi:hypothetical protein
VSGYFSCRVRVNTTCRFWNTTRHGHRVVSTLTLCNRVRVVSCFLVSCVVPPVVSGPFVYHPPVWEATAFLLLARPVPSVLSSTLPPLKTVHRPCAPVPSSSPLPFLPSTTSLQPLTDLLEPCGRSPLQLRRHGHGPQHSRRRPGHHGRQAPPPQE